MDEKSITAQQNVENGKKVLKKNWFEKREETANDFFGLNKDTIKFTYTHSSISYVRQNIFFYAGNQGKVSFGGWTIILLHQSNKIGISTLRNTSIYDFCDVILKSFPWKEKRCDKVF